MTHGEVLILEPESDDLSRPTNYRTSPFGFMFPDLQRDDENLLENSPKTVANLRKLGEAMLDPGETTIPGIPIPAIHTFFAQFVDHDITLEQASADIVPLDNPTQLSLEQITTLIVNSRSPNLDLDHVYGPDINGTMSPRDLTNPAKMLIHEVEPYRGLPPGKDVWNDLPRLPDGTPQIGDSRNDENIITGQLHVAFLRAHNAIVDRAYRFDEARKLLIQHYQWLVLDDFLERVADPNIVKMIRHKGARFFNPPARWFYMPLEFSVAAYRFGHSKVRASYDRFNEKQNPGGLDLLFRPSRRLTDDWVIEWPSFLDPENPARFSRPIDTSLTKKLLNLVAAQLPKHNQEPNLAIRNLLRGYILRLPTGQAIAKAMASQGILPMTDKQIESVVRDIPYQIDAIKRMEKETDFLNRTPLWFYILAEAAFYNRGHHLGPVGSTIVAEVLIGVLRRSTYSILSHPQWRPTLGDTPGKFDLEDLLKLAGVF